MRVYSYFWVDKRMFVADMNKLPANSMSRYEIAFDEFENGDDDEKYKLVYAYFGLAIYQAQVLEGAFSIMLWTNRIFKKQAKSKLEINEIIETIENSKKLWEIYLMKLSRITV